MTETDWENALIRLRGRILDSLDERRAKSELQLIDEHCSVHFGELVVGRELDNLCRLGKARRVSLANERGRSVPGYVKTASKAYFWE